MMWLALILLWLMECIVEVMSLYAQTLLVLRSGAGDGEERRPEGSPRSHNETIQLGQQQLLQE